MLALPPLQVLRDAVKRWLQESQQFNGVAKKCSQYLLGVPPSKPNSNPRRFQIIALRKGRIPNSENDFVDFARISWTVRNGWVPGCW